MSNDWTPWIMTTSASGEVTVDPGVENGEDGIWLTTLGGSGMYESKQFLTVDEVGKLVNALTEASKIRHIFDEDDTLLCSFDERGFMGGSTISIIHGPGFVCNKCKTALEKWAV